MPGSRADDCDYPPAGTKGAVIADYAARLEIPVVRFISAGAAVGPDAPSPLFERPAALVFAAEEDRHAFDIEQMADAVRAVMEPAKSVPPLLLQSNPASISKIS